MKEYRVIIPDEHYDLINFRQENLPGVAVVNSALKNFKPKEVFDWQCSVILDLENLVENGMPSKDEVKLVDEYGDYLDDNIKGANKEKPNALFLGRVTWNKTRRLIWRICDPEITDKFLQKIIKDNSSPRQFEYSIDHDKTWDLAKWYLSEWT